MNAEFLTDLVTGNADTLAAIVNNGEVKVLVVDDPLSTDAQGFPNAAPDPDEGEFFACNWSLRRATSGVSAGEDVVGERSTGHLEYEITVPWLAGVDAPQVDVSDQLELRRVAGVDSSIVLNVYAVINQNNTAWLIRAIDLNA